ncbi:glycosyltransferase family 2 protein [Cochlodiniinecator piscidefendens]|uniref:glycosyltransferase family 2 protein n=1 Tax=Cochlodiniinecator piscidefendens TaxID=2715756 RepID=UPI00140DA727|nr:glycosyltransferase family 2 protein [Cochlodiniinecator piscidefendens]
MSDRVTVVTVMKDEAPFILEWIAWNQMIGVSHFIVLTNNCSDGTDTMLDRLDDMGIVTHLPNPFGLFDRGTPQGTALKYVPQLKEYRRSDWIMHSDVDEFLHIKDGTGTIHELIEASGRPDAISIGECLMGCSGIEAYEDVPVTSQFTHGMRQETPEGTSSRRGVKTLFRNSDVWRNRKNHRPIIRPTRRDEVTWVDGSGQPVPDVFRDGREPGMECSGRYDLAVLYHYSMRSMESFLTKLSRGDAVRSSRTKGWKYWRKRNQNTESYPDMLDFQPRLQANLEKLKSDPELAKLHEAACDIHRSRIQDARQNPEFDELIAFYQSTLWGDPKFAE